MKEKISFIIFLTLYTLNTFSQENFTVHTKISSDTIGFNDILTVRFEANSDEAELKEPVFNDFEIYKDKSISTEQSYKNDKKTSKIAVTYFLKPKRTGKLILENVIFEYNGKPFITNSVSIEVGEKALVNNSFEKENKIFIIPQISNYNPYCYQPVTVEYKLYFDDDFQPLSFKYDFEKEYLDQYKIYSIEKDYNITKEKIGKKEYNCILINTDVIRFKELKDTYINNRIIVEYKKTRKSTPNYEYLEETYEKILPVVSERIKPKKIEMDNLFPFEITSFGNYKLDVIYPEETNVKKNKIIEITLQLYGDGYLEDAMIPDINISNAFEIISNTLKNDSTLENGKIKTIAIRTYKIKALLEGNYTFYPVKFYFYNEGKGEKKAISSKEFTLFVK